jgi:hypothetical protein
MTGLSQPERRASSTFRWPAGKGTGGPDLEAMLAIKRSVSTRFLDPKRKRWACEGFMVSSDPLDNVTAVGIGQRLRARHLTDEWCIRIYVEHKIERAALPESTLLPTDVEGVPVDVIESGWFSAYVMPVERRRVRPAQPGCSVGVCLDGGTRLTAGTLGAVVGNRRERYILSNSHVIDPDNTGRTGADVFQPGYLDDQAPESIGAVAALVPLQYGVSNFVDCAMAVFPRPDLVSATFLPPLGQLPRAAPVDPVRGMAVAKVGRTSGHTTGAIVDPSTDVRVTLPSGTFVFQDQFLVQGDPRPWPVAYEKYLSRWLLTPLTAFRRRSVFSAPGDSGSVIVESQTRSAVGLLVGGSSKGLTVANPLGRVLAELDVALIV